MRYANLDNTLIRLSFPYDHQLVQFVRTLPMRKFDPETKSWTFPLDVAGPQIPKLAAFDFHIDPAITRAIEGRAEEAEELESLAVQDDISFETSLPLLPYQKVGAAFIKRIKSGLLGDDVGCGKTIQSIAVVEANPEVKKVLVFCPAVLKYQWENELHKFLNGNVTVSVVDGTPDERREAWMKEAKYYIANYELLLRDLSYFQQYHWDYIIADEATKIANPWAKQSKAIKTLKSRHRIALTGTPISNRPEELWNVIDFTNPGVLGNYIGFVDRYCIKNKWGGIFQYQNLDELGGMVKKYMIRRMKTDVLKELPEKIASDVPVKLSEQEKKLYDQIKMEILFEIEKEDIDKINNPVSIQNTLVKMLRLKQLTDSMELLGSKPKSSKLEALQELLSTLEGRKVIIFTQFAEMAKILERELVDYHPLVIMGEVDNETRQLRVSSFNTMDTHKILIMTSAGMYGLNIQAASVVIHFDQEWSLAKMIQRTGRAWRMGQKQSVLEYSLLAKGSIDMYIKNVLRKKQSISDRILMQDVEAMLNYEND